MAEFGEPIDVEKTGDKTREDSAEFGEPIQVDRKEEKLGEAMEGREHKPSRRTGGTNRWRERAPAVLGRSGGGRPGGKRGLRRRVTAGGGAGRGGGGVSDTEGGDEGVVGDKLGRRFAVNRAGSSAIHRATSMTVDDSTAPVGVM